MDATVAPGGAAWQGVKPGGYANNVAASLPAYTSSGSPSNDDDYETVWSASATSWLAYDVSGAGLSTVVLQQTSTNDDGLTVDYDFAGQCPSYSGRAYLAAYTVQGNTAAGGGSAPGSGWTTLATVAASTWQSKQHALDLTGYNWVRVNVTSAPNGISCNIDLADHSDGANDGWCFTGDSITNTYAAHGGGDWTEAIIADTSGARKPLYVHYAMACTKASDATGWLDTLLDSFHGKYVALNFGANDGYGGDLSAGTISSFNTNMTALVAEVVSRGMVPVIPSITWPNNGGTWESGIESLNAEIDSVVAGTAAIAGPDLYTLTYGQTSWFQSAGNVHPNATGATAIFDSWLDFMLGVY